MNTRHEITDAEIMKALNDAMDFAFGVKEDKKKARAGKAKADFFNLNEMAKNSEVLFF